MKFYIAGAFSLLSWREDLLRKPHITKSCLLRHRKVARWVLESVVVTSQWQCPHLASSITSNFGLVCWNYYKKKHDKKTLGHYLKKTQQQFLGKTHTCTLVLGNILILFIIHVHVPWYMGHYHDMYCPQCLIYCPYPTIGGYTCMCRKN